MSTRALSTDASLMFHLVHHMGKGAPMTIGTMKELQGVVKIMDSPEVAAAIATRHYPYLPERQYLVACVDNWLDVKVWGIYVSGQIEAMEKNRSSPQVRDIEWKVLEIPEALEAELRKRIIDVPEGLPPSPCPHCTIL